MLMHGRCSRASDVYAFGILLWEVATGGKAFAGRWPGHSAASAAAQQRQHARRRMDICMCHGCHVMRCTAAAGGAPLTHTHGQARHTLVLAVSRLGQLPASFCGRLPAKG